MENVNQNGSEGQSPDELEKQLQQQREQTAEQQRRAAEFEAESARLKFENATVKHNQAVEAAVQGAVYNMGLEAYSLPAIIKLLNVGDAGIEIKRSAAGPVVLVDGKEADWTSAIAKFAQARPTFFRGQSVQRQPSSAELEAKAKMGNYQPPVPEDGIRAWSDFRSREQKIAWMSNNPDKIDTLAPDRSKLRNGRNVYSMTRSELNSLKPAEKAAIIKEIGLHAWESVVARSK